MNLDLATFLQLDLPALMAAVLAVTSCALVGNFLVLRGEALMGDAVSHAVLPGIVIGFLLTEDRAPGPVFLGALAAALLCAACIEAARRYGRLEPGVAMGVVFSVFFAGGVVMMEAAAANHVDLDADCILYGQLEDILWLAPTSLQSLADIDVWLELPREVWTLALVCAGVAAAIKLFFKELTMASFDEGFASAAGFSAGVVHMGFMALVGVVAVAAFEAVGSILVVAMFVCPPAAARLMTDRLPTQIALSVLVAAASAIVGYAAAVAGPPLFAGSPNALGAAGMIAVVAGSMLALAAIFGPRRRGVAPRRGGP